MLVSHTLHFSDICRLLPPSASCLNVIVCLQVAQLSTERCGGFRVLPHREFFPIPYTNWQLFFDESKCQQVMDEIKDSFGVHLWNKLSKNTAVNVGSQQPYSLIAARACPRTYAMCGGHLWRRRGAARRDATLRHYSDILSGQMNDNWQLQCNSVSGLRSQMWQTAAVCEIRIYMLVARDLSDWFNIQSNALWMRRMLRILQNLRATGRGVWLN